MDDKHTLTANELELAAPETQTLQTAVEQNRSDLQTLLNENTELKRRLAEAVKSDKSTLDKNQLMIEYLDELGRCLLESEQLSSDMKEKRLEEIKKLVDAIEQEKQKQIQWVDYAE